MAEASFLHFYRNIDRHGNPRRYFRRRIPNSKKHYLVRLRTDPLEDLSKFRAEYSTAELGWQTLFSKHTLGRTAGLIYFVAMGDFVKIGFTTNLESRLQTLQTSSPEPLRLIKAVVGYKCDEADLHIQFSASRMSGEWFQMTPSLAELIASKVNHIAELRGIIREIFEVHHPASP